MPSGLKIFLGWGQSNMYGVTTLNLAPRYDHASQIWNYQLDGNWQNPAADPICGCATSTYTVLSKNGLLGPLMSFADQWIRFHPTHSVGLVTCAKSGRLMSDFARSTDTSTMYGAGKARFDAVASAGTITGAIMYQGEANCDTTTHRDEWLTGFTQWCADIRSDTGIPSLPIVLVKIAKFGGQTKIDFPYNSDMKEIQSRVRISRVAIAQIDDAVLFDGEAHLDGASHKLIGTRIADAFRILGA